MTQADLSLGGKASWQDETTSDFTSAVMVYWFGLLVWFSRFLDFPTVPNRMILGT